MNTNVEFERGFSWVERSCVVVGEALLDMRFWVFVLKVGVGKLGG